MGKRAIERRGASPLIAGSAASSRNSRLGMLTLFLAPALLASGGGCDRPGSTSFVVISGPTMGTRFHVKLRRMPAGTDADRLREAVHQRLETVNDQMSTYRADSEISRFNARIADDWFAVSPATASVVREALRVSALSGGAFDVTVGPLVDLWGFGPEGRTGRLPEESAIEAARAQSGYEKLEVRDAPAALRKKLPGLRVDLSAIAKGYAVDHLAAYLESLGVDDYLVEIGGEMRARGKRSASEEWRLAIEKPVATGRLIQKVLTIGDRALATSGDYRNAFDVDGRRYSHTLDPRSGRPVTHELASVSVVASSCMEADALATALMVLGPDAGYDLAERLGLAAFFVTRGASGFEENASTAMRPLLERNPDG